MIVKFYNAKILQNHQIVKGELWVNDGKIVKPKKTADIKVNVKGHLLAPGFIDMQVNGGGGVDLATHPDSVAVISRQLPKLGVTSFLPTLISLPKEDYPRAINALQQSKVMGASILGIHLEGPFLNPEFSGAHNPKFLKTFDDIQTLEGFYGTLRGVKMMTLAPELPGSIKWISYLAKKGILVSAGHTSATQDIVRKAMKSGLKMITHLFNGMASFHHRAPGIVGEALTNDNLSYSLIADGVHLSAETIKLAWRSNPRGLALISDCMAGLGLKPGTYNLGEECVEVNEKSAHLKGINILAGSIEGLDTCVRNLIKATGCTVVQALEAASLKPAELLGLQGSKGTLAPGADADFIILDQDLNVLETYIAGNSTIL